MSAPLFVHNGDGEHVVVTPKLITAGSHSYALTEISEIQNVKTRRSRGPKVYAAVPLVIGGVVGAWYVGLPLGLLAVVAGVVGAVFCLRKPPYKYFINIRTPRGPVRALTTADKDLAKRFVKVLHSAHAAATEGT